MDSINKKYIKTLLDKRKEKLRRERINMQDKRKVVRVKNRYVLLKEINDEINLLFKAMGDLKNV